MILIFSTISFFQEMRINGAATNNGQHSKRWYETPQLSYLKIGYLFIIGCLFMIMNCKYKNCHKLGKYCNFFYPEYKLWTFCSIIQPFLILLSQIIEGVPNSEEKKGGEAISIILLFIQVAQFYIIYIYLKSCWKPVSQQFFSLYRNKWGIFDSARFTYYATRIFGILFLEIIIFAAFNLLIQNFLTNSKSSTPSNGTENQNQIVGKLNNIKQGQEIGRFIFTVITLIIISPFIEEIIYRKVTLKTTNFNWKTIFTSSIIFSLSHINVTKETIFHLWPYLLGGFTYALTYKYFKNIWVGILTHSLHNLITLIIVLWKIFNPHSVNTIATNTII
ncbi:CPBP family intramembrane glutamic endopeptidase [Mycoplasma parvum]|uniref:CAAX prenyl protease 2/Lysostaphin resistance protein A-like domain-containing protein n=1 Tax=Mycoplasma parvum str. Indiana TaxID=1403316 RepID=U5NCB7_9MOLU|nr:type II CAAX endopeptidase family protein [Mycoplasma parvum]AGX89226.1 hypothetical protein PRV_02450 [Mycoplasma parvum str. Indiana]